LCPATSGSCVNCVVVGSECSAEELKTKSERIVSTVAGNLYAIIAKKMSYCHCDGDDARRKQLFFGDELGQCESRNQPSQQPCAN
jgi:hypothetical protein